MRKGRDMVEVWHGPWVETRGDWFLEGAWAGPFAEGRFDEAHTLAGSGGRATEDGFIFASSSNMNERIQSVQIADELLVSNSIPFLLAATGDEPDPLYRFYRDDLAAHVRAGIRETCKTLHTRRGRQLLLHDMANLSIRPDLSIRRIEKRVPPPPGDFSGYVSLLQTSMESLLRNASDSERAHQRYRPLATLSRGYDSAAAAVLLKRMGVAEAMTFCRHEPRYAI